MNPQYYFEAGELPWTEESYGIFVTIDECDETEDITGDAIGIHIPEVNRVMQKLGITGESEDCFFTHTYDEKTIEDVTTILKNEGWKERPGLLQL